MEFLGLAASVIMGIILGLIGGGGSILTVPILVYLFQMPPLVATTYSLAIVGITSAVGAAVKAQTKEVDFSAAATFALPSFLGISLSRTFFVPATPDVILFAGVSLPKSVLIMAVFAVVMLLSSTAMLRSRKVTPQKGHWSQTVSKGFGIGVLTGYIGAGGGFLIVPALVVLIGLPMRLAVGTSMLIIALNSFVGLGNDILRGTTFDVILILKIVALALAGLFLGIKISKTIDEQKLKKSFGIFVLIVGCFILADQWRLMIQP